MDSRLIRMRPTPRLLAGVVVALLAVAAGVGLAARTRSAPPARSASSSQDVVAPAGLGPQGTVLDPLTHTLYVADGAENTVSVIDAAACNAKVTSGCARKQPATVLVGTFPTAIDVDVATDTIYVANSNDNTVSVINGSTCNAENTSVCIAADTVNVGVNPVDLRVNQTTNTVYVANLGYGTGTTVSVIDGKTCNGPDSSGCAKAPASVTIGTGPTGVIVDPSTDTIYVATVATDLSGAVWVIDGASCNATTTSGCRRRPPSVKVGNGANLSNTAMAVDQDNDTIYVDNYTDNTVSMIDTASCNAMFGSLRRA
jgi:DNA-binding beta-propeller fold protein YncE